LFCESRRQKGRQRRSLPEPLPGGWIPGSPTLARRLANSCLTVERSGDALLLEETRDEFGLTAAGATSSPG
jgi:hypothetical protein